MNRPDYLSSHCSVRFMTNRLILPLAAVVFTLGMPGRASAEDDKSEEVFPSTSIHAGEIASLTATTSSVEWLDLEELMVDGNLERGASAGSAGTERQPGDDKLFIIIGVELAEDRSIGKYDYNLRVKGEELECEGIAAEEDDPFDPRIWQVEYDQRRKPVRLLYEAPRFQSETVIDLVPALDTTVELEQHELTVKPPPESAD